MSIKMCTLYGNYIRILDLDPKFLQKTTKHFWVGVISGVYPSPPIDRTKTNCFSRLPVYFYKDRLVFEIASVVSGMDYYYIPKNEMKFIEER